MDTIQMSRDDRAITIAFNRPEKRNALDVEMTQTLTEMVRDASEYPLPVIFTSSTPGMFVSGTDMGTLKTRTVDESLGRLNSILMHSIWTHPWPTIAVVDGPALGGGFELALACDFRIGSPASAWGFPEVRLGFPPSAGGLQRLPQVAGWTAATDLILTGRRLNAFQAEEFGILTTLVTADGLDAAVGTLLDELGKAAPQAVRLAKEAMRVQGDRDRIVDALAQAVCLAQPDTQERLTKAIGAPSDDGDPRGRDDEDP